MVRIKIYIIILLIQGLFIPSFVHAFGVSDIENINNSYGLSMPEQSFCLTDGSQKVIDYNSDTLRVPASVSKLYVTDWVLATLPKDFSFKTRFTRSDNTVYIYGGNDPQFISEHLWYALYRISHNSPTVITKIVFDNKFIFNWEFDSTIIKNNMFNLLKKPERVSGGVLARTRARLIYNKDGTGKVPTISQKIKVFSVFSHTTPTVKTSYLLFSPTRDFLLKEMNIFSNNLMANSFFTVMGGLELFNTYMKKTYSVSDKNFNFTTGSGLAGNFVTCNLTLDVLKHMHQQTMRENILIENIMALPGEEGTLTRRLLQSPYKKSIVMKTGNVGKYVTLAGIIKTTTGYQYFTFLNTAKDSSSFEVNQVRKFQDDILLRYVGTLQSVDFTPEDSRFIWSHFTFKKE